MNNNPSLPKARKSGLIVKELPDETLVYDRECEKAHCLNRTAALVWKNCDGTKSLGEVSTILSQDLGAPIDSDLIWLAIDQLEASNLLVESTVKPTRSAGVSRRHLLRNMGIAAALLPAVISIVAPIAVEAQSPCLGNNAMCTPTGTPCCAPQTCLPHPSGMRCQ